MFFNENVAYIYCFSHAAKSLPGAVFAARLPEMTAVNAPGFFFQTIDDPLQEVTVQIISDSECNNSYAIFGGITDRMICAGDPNGGKGACWVIGL